MHASAGPDRNPDSEGATRRVRAALRRVNTECPLTGWSGACTHHGAEWALQNRQGRGSDELLSISPSELGGRCVGLCYSAHHVPPMKE